MLPADCRKPVILQPAKGMPVKRKSRNTETRIVFEELEPRVLLSADPLAVATDANMDTVHEQVIDNNEFTPGFTIIFRRT